MCGICGFISKKQLNKDILIKMNQTLTHRGPDDHGEEIYTLKNGTCVGFAHRRLSIIDLSARGHQPMHSVNGRISVVYNGEIYNFKELKKQLSMYAYQTHSDTEIIISAYLKWGIDFVKYINGMFTIALFDREEEIVYFIRDRIGKKPFYYYINQEGDIAFGSELKVLRECPFFVPEVNQNIIGRFLYQRYLIAPDTIYQNTYKLEPGSILYIKNGKIKKKKYWDIAERYQDLRKKSYTNYEEAKEVLRDLLKESISKRLMADVPVGAFLSGGYDSSLICAIAQELSEKPIKSFCIGFWEEELNEAIYAKRIADYLGTEHEELYINEKDLLQILESIPIYYDEPFADASQIPSMIISEFAKQQVSVILSGDGGDELFGGYPIYKILQEVQRRRWRGKLLYTIRHCPGMKNLSRWKRLNLVDKILSEDQDKEARTQGGVSTYINVIDSLLLQSKHNYYYEFESKYCESDYAITRMLLDMDTWLPEDILTKIDRASMKYALECRCPILDKEIIEFSMRCPISYKIGNHGIGKKIWKDLTHEYIPAQLMERPKQGFYVPLDKWLRTVLKERLYTWTELDYLKKQGIFQPEVTQKFIRTYIQEGDKGKNTSSNYSKICWSYFIFQQWYGKWIY